MGWATIGVAVLHHNSPAVDEALGGSRWWWLLIASLLVYTIWSDLRSSRMPKDTKSPDASVGRAVQMDREC